MDVAYLRKKKTKFRIALNVKEKPSPLVLDLAEQEKFRKKQRRSFFCGVMPTRIFLYRSKLLDSLIDERLITSVDGKKKTIRGKIDINYTL